MKICRCIPRALFSILLATLLGCQQQPRRHVIHVSPQGRDDWSGRFAQPNAAKTDGPLHSLTAAQNAVRQLKRENKFSPGGCAVQLHSGVYSIAETRTFNEEDSGTDSATVIWQAAPGEAVVLSGGQEIRGFEPVTEAAVLQRLTASARAHVLQTNLRTQGISDFGAISEKGGPGLEVFFNDARLQLARYPNEGYLKITSVPQTGAKLINEGSWQWQRFGIPVGRHFGMIRYADDHPRRWQPAPDIGLHGYFCWDWRDGFQQVKSIDARKQEITLAPPYHNYGFHQEQRFYFLNVLEELDQPGEWYLDRESGMFYLWPPAPLENASIKVSVLKGPLLALNNASHLRFENIIFELSRTNGVEIKGGSHNLIAGCTVRNVGMTAIVIDGGNNQGVQSCDIYNIGGGGVILNSGDRKTLTSGNSFVDNTHFHHFGQVRKTTCPAIDTRGVGTRIIHNLLHDSPDAGVMYWGNEMLLEYNEVHDIARESDDVGAFYFGRDYTMRGNVIRYNYFHHLQKPMYVGVMSVYLDDFASGATIFGNIFYEAGRAVFVGGGRDHIIENNIFVECSPSIFLDARGLVRNTEFFDGRITTLMDRMKEMNYTAPPFSEKYPELLALYNDDPARPKYNRIRRNISVGGRWLDLYSGLDLSLLEIKNNLIADPVIFRTSVETGVETESFAEFQRENAAVAEAFTQRGNKIIAGDPGFVDLQNGDFRLRDDSPAFQLGFEKIPVHKIGLYLDIYRKTLPEIFNKK
jgi:hypothetical protein